MTRLLIIAAMTLTACSGPRSGETVNIGPGPHMTTAHPAFTACDGPAQHLGGNEYRCR